MEIRYKLLLLVFFIAIIGFNCQGVKKTKIRVNAYLGKNINDIINGEDMTHSHMTLFKGSDDLGIHFHGKRNSIVSDCVR